MPSPADPVAISLLGIDIRWYALFMLAGVLAGVALTRFLAVRLGLDPDWVFDAVPWIVVASIVGARLYYVLLRADHFLVHPMDAINTRLGGMSFHGGLIAGIVAFVLLCRTSGQPFLRWTDVAIPGVALAQAVGRWGNWANQEAFGGPTDLPWGLSIEPQNRPAAFADVERFHPTFLYESLFNLANAVLLSWLALRVPANPRLRHGDILGLYLVNYGVGRFLIEGLRTDSLFLGPLPAAYWLSWALILVGLVVLIVPRLRSESSPDRM